MKQVNAIIRPLKNIAQSILESNNMKIIRLIHGSIIFIEEGNHWEMKCPIKNENLKVAEIGVYRGVNSEEIMKYLNVKKIYLIDPYQKYEKTYMGEQNWDSAEEEARKRMSKFGNKVVFIKKYSYDAVNEIPNDMDYIYLDGNHNYKYIKSDINNYYQKLKINGILAGHDVGIQDVLRAVLEFTAENNLNFFIKKDDWIIIKEGKK